MHNSGKDTLTNIAAFFVVFSLATAIFTYSSDDARAERRVNKILEKQDQVFLEESMSTLALAKSWMLGNVRPDGLFYYEYNPATDKDSQKNDGINDLRELLASRILATECSKTKDADICAKHRKNIEYIFRNWYKEDKIGAHIIHNGKSKLGATADFLRVLLASPDFPKYHKEASALYRNIRHLQNEDGSFDPWYIAPSYKYFEDHLLTFYAGQALIALVEYYEKTGNEEVLQAALKSQEHYIGHYSDRIRENFYPSYVPWQTQALVKLYALVPRKEYADAVFIMNDKLLQMQDRTDHIGRFYNPATPQYGDPHSSSDGVDTEGLTYALDLAITVGDKEREMRYMDAIKLSIHNLESLQYKPEDAKNFVGDPIRFIGAFRTEFNKSWIRIDTTTHVVDALEQLLQTWKRVSVR